MNPFSLSQKKTPFLFALCLFKHFENAFLMLNLFSFNARHRDMDPGGVDQIWIRSRIPPSRKTSPDPTLETQPRTVSDLIHS